MVNASTLTTGTRLEGIMPVNVFQHLSYVFKEKGPGYCCSPCSAPGPIGGSYSSDLSRHSQAWRIQVATKLSRVPGHLSLWGRD